MVWAAALAAAVRRAPGWLAGRRLTGREGAHAAELESWHDGEVPEQLADGHASPLDRLDAVLAGEGHERVGDRENLAEDGEGHLALVRAGSDAAVVDDIDRDVRVVVGAHDSLQVAVGRQNDALQGREGAANDESREEGARTRPLVHDVA